MTIRQLLLVSLALARVAVAQDSTAARPVRITYLTASAAYLDAGLDDGLHQDDTLRVRRGAVEVASLRVAYLASRQASCDILDGAAGLVVGDTVDAIRLAPAKPSALASGPAALPRGRGRPLRGRIGARYLGVWRRDGTGSHFTQPSFDLRLDGQGLAGAPIGLVLDLRTRRTIAVDPAGASTVDGRTRAYQAALVVTSPGAPFRLTMGRQFSPSLASITLFDGALAQLDRPTWGVGLFGGSEPDPVSYSYSADVADYGGYVQLHARAEATTRWSTTLGAIGSYQGGLANREFGFLQLAVTGAGYSVYASQELDYYRPWKRAMGEPTLSPSSSFATAQFDVSSGLSLNAGLDSRRNVRLYRDAVTPETAFDDSFRRGVWGGLALRLGDAGRGRIALDARSSTGGSLGRTLSYTLGLSVDRLTQAYLGVRSRTTRYTSIRQSGWLQSVSVGLSPVAPLHVELNGGLRIEQNPLADPTSVQVTWVGTDFDLGISRGWYLLLSGTHEAGGFEGNDQLYTGLTYRF